MIDPDRIPPAALLEGAALFLDFDGTLVDLADTPDAVSVSPHLPRLLEKLSERLDGRLAIVSGRSIESLETHLDCAGRAVAGSHGLEIRFADGTAIPVARPKGLDRAYEYAREVADTFPGILVERKPAGVAVHYRQVPEAAAHVLAALESRAAAIGFQVQTGKMLVELRPTGIDKGSAVRVFMSRPPFRGATPVFIGDDLTDEDAFEAAVALGGTGILVGQDRPTAAAWRLNDVAAVADWLTRSARIDG
jgi:trehalose 6-phosphate phosphatase